MQIPWIKPVWYSPLTLVPFGLIAVGWWQDAKIARGLAAPYFVFYLAIILLWPFDEGTRFLIPISPLLWLYVFSGAAAVVDSIRQRRRWPTLAVRTLSAIALAGSLVSILAQQDHASRQDVGAVIVWTALLGVMVTIRPGFALQVLAATPKRAATWIPLATTLYVLIGVTRVAPTAWAAVTGAPPSEPTALALSRAAEWVNTNTSPCAVIQSTLPDRMNFATGRKSVIFPVASSQDALRQVTERFTPNYLIVLDSTRYPYFSPSDQQRLAMMQSLFPGRLQEVHRFEGGAVYFMDWRPF